MFTSMDVNWQRFAYGTPVELKPLGEDIGEAEYFDMDVTIIPDWNTSVYLEWVPPQELAAGAKYVIYYSESELGPFTSLNEQPTSDTSYFTTWQVQDSKVYEQYFTIELITDDGRYYRSYPKYPGVAMSKWHMLRHRDIIRREAILLDRFTGVETVVFNRKRRGLRCTECWDPLHEKVTKEHCDTCYGVSYEGGYDTGMRTKLQYSSIDPQSTFSYQGKEENIMLSAWGLPFPLLHPGSIILRVGDRRVFRVEAHQGSTEMLTNVQRQNVVLKELSRDSIENKLFNREDITDVPVRSPHVHH